MSKSDKKAEVTSAELEVAENELRAKAKSLYSDIEVTYWELGKVLYEVYDGLPGGYRDLLKGDGARETRRELFKKWGYNSFEEWCEREIGILRRSASNLRYAYWWFEVQLKLPTELKNQLMHLGRSKVYLLAGFVNNDNIMSWVEKAMEMTHDELKKAVAAVKAVDKRPSDSDNEMFEHAKAGALDPSAPPPPENTHMFATSLYDGQFDTLNAALDRAKSVTGSDKKSHNLEMICTDFLSTNDFMDPADDQRRYLAKVESLTKLKLIAIDPSTGKAVYGADLLWGMVKQRLEFESEEREAKNTEVVNERTVSVNGSDDEPPAMF